MIKNITKNTIISQNYEIALGLKKTQGLINKKRAKTIILNTRFGIHTIFLKFSIDVLVLDKNNIVKIIKKDLKPNRIFLWNPKYGLVIELPRNFIKKSKTAIGDQISL